MGSLRQLASMIEHVHAEAALARAVMEELQPLLPYIEEPRPDPDADILPEA